MPTTCASSCGFRHIGLVLDEQYTHAPMLAERTKALWRGHVERHLIPFFGNLKMNEVKRQHVRAFLLKKRQDGLAEATIRSICSPLRAILDEAVEENLLAVSPWVKVPKKERPKGKPQSVKRILTVDEIDRLLAEAEQRGPGLKAFASTLVFAGLRIGEALGLVWSDIDFDTGEIRNRQQLIQHTTRRGPLKTKASRREVPISTELRKALKTWWLASEFKCDQHFVFSTLSGRPTTHRNALRALQRAATAVGLNVDTQERDEAVARGEDLPPNVDAHCLRHLFASAMIRATKGDAEKVAKLTGHDDVKTLLDVYSHDFTAVRGGRDIQKDIELIDAAFAG
jgi:integrase